MQTRLPGVNLCSKFLKTTFDRALTFVGCLRREKFRHQLLQILESSCIVVLKILLIFLYVLFNIFLFAYKFCTIFRVETNVKVYLFGYVITN